MASQWFYQVMGEQVGPISGVELRNLAQRGTISRETPIANAANGPWVPAERVKSLFAAPIGVRPSAVVKGTVQVPPRDAAAKDESSGLGAATKAMMGVCGGVCLLAVGFLVWFIVSRDTWELDNAPRVSARLEEANRLQRSDPLAAYKAYDEVLKEVKTHKVTDEQFAKNLGDAEKSKANLYPKVQEKIRAEEAENQRRVAEEARRAAAERQRIAEEEGQKRAAAEAQRIAEEKRLAEEKRRKEALAVYRNAPQSAHNVLNIVKKIGARTEVGINYRDYSTVVGDAWGDVKIFIESSEAKNIPEFSTLLAKVMRSYRLALDIWRNKVEWPGLYGDRADVETLLQACWARAGQFTKLAESLLDPEKTEDSLKAIAGIRENEDDLDAAWKKIEDSILHRDK